MPTIEIYKRNQGKYTRLGTFIGAVLVGGIGAVLLGQKAYASLPDRPFLQQMGRFVEYGVPVLIIAALGALMFWVVNRPKTADFLIATEGEMKKVSWSSRKEVVGSTKVVIVTSVILSMILLAVDLVFIKFFGWLGVM